MFVWLLLKYLIIMWFKKSKDTIKTHSGEKTLHLRERYAVYNLGITF